MLLSFSKYTVIGVLNTATHWLVFYICLYLGLQQAIANLIGFMIAVTLSFILNAKFNFSSRITLYKYIIYVAFLGAMAFSFGFIADKYDFPSLVTLVCFSLFSLVLGFLYSHFVVFRSVP